MAADRQRERRLRGERSRRARALPRIQKDTAAEVGRILGLSVRPAFDGAVFGLFDVRDAALG